MACLRPVAGRYFPSMGDPTPSRDPLTRVTIRASLLVMVLLSVSAEASVRGFGEVSHSARIAMQARMIADRLLPAATEAGLARGIRFAEPTGPAAQLQIGQAIPVADATIAPVPTLLREELLSLPPPAY